MQTTLENWKKVTIDSPRSLLKRKYKVEEGGSSSSRVKKEQESIDLKAHKMMGGRVEPFAASTMVRVVSTMIQATK